MSEHTCGGGMNPPHPYPCKSCEEERSPTSTDALGKLLEMSDEEWELCQTVEGYCVNRSGTLRYEIQAQRRRVGQLEAENERLKVLARPEHELVVSIEKRLLEIGHLSDSPDANITGAIHGLIEGYVRYRADLKAAEARR